MSASVVSTIHLRIFSVFGLSVRHCLSTFGATSVISSEAILTFPILNDMVTQSVRKCLDKFYLDTWVHLTGTVLRSTLPPGPTPVLERHERITELRINEIK